MAQKEPEVGEMYFHNDGTKDIYIRTGETCTIFDHDVDGWDCSPINNIKRKRWTSRQTINDIIILNNKLCYILFGLDNLD